MFCNNCGCDNPDGVNFCSRCGAQMDSGYHYQMPTPPQFPQSVPRKDNKSKLPLIIIAVASGIIVIGGIIWLIIAGNNGNKRHYDDEEEDDGIELVRESKASQAPSQSLPAAGGIDEIANMDFGSSYVSESWLSGLSKQELCVARNAIYARHGRYFQSKDLQEIFGRCTWYNPYRSEVPQSELNKFEKSNIKTIQSWE